MFNTTLNTTERPWDGWLLLIVCALVGIGIVMIYSASGITATWLTGDSAFFLKRQLIYLAGGLLFLILDSKSITIGIAAPHGPYSLARYSS